MEYESDEVLVGIFEHGGNRGAKAIEVLFRRHLPKVYSLCRRYFAIREDAEEATSETFLRAFRGLANGQFRGDALYRTWLMRIASNTCIERIRQPRLPMLSLDILPPEHEPISSSSLDRDLQLTAAIRSLPDDQCLAITLCDLEGYSAKEAAQIIGRSGEAMKSLHYRARRALREILE